MVLAALEAGCAALPPQVTRPATQAIAASPTTTLGRLAENSVASGADSGFRPLPMSAYSMDARLTLARRAERSLDLQYYLLENDVTGHTLLRAVRDAARRGVRVRILVDDLYTESSDRLLVELAAYPNIEVRVFNPFPAGRAFAATRWAFALTDFARLNHRMHNKMFIADGAFAIAGGRNIADEYFFSSQEGNFVDFDLLLAGAALPRLQAIFDSYWNSPRVYPLNALETSDAPRAELEARFEEHTRDAATAYATPPADAPDLLGRLPISAEIEGSTLPLLFGHVEVFADDPEKVSGRSERGDDETTVTHRVLAAMGAARFSVTVGSPYFIPGPDGLAQIRALCARGVAFEVVTNSTASNDEPLASAAYGRYRVAMLQMGADLYELNPEALSHDPLIGTALRASIGRSHSKLVVIDRHITFVGSMNMDLRSSRENTELGMLVDSSELAREILALADKVRAAGTYHLRLAATGDRVQWVAQENGTSVVYDSEPGVDFGTQLEIFLWSPFISESLL